MVTISDMELAAAVLDIVPLLDLEVVTIRIVMQKLAAHFGVDYKDMLEHKPAIKKLVMSNLGADDEHEKENVAAKRVRKSNRISDDDEDEEGDEEEDEEEETEELEEEEEEALDDSENDAPKKRRRSSPKAAPVKRKASAKKATPPAKKATPPAKKTTPPAKKARQNADSPGMAALKDMARAARLLSPRVYAALKKLETEAEQEELIRDLLSNNGIRFSGRYPQKREIDSVRKKKDLEKDMEGIDTSLIIDDTSDRPRRASRSAGVSYTDQLYNNAASDDDEEAQVKPGKQGDDDDDDDEGGSKNKRKSAAGHKRSEEEEEEEEEADDDAFEENDSDSSEAEF